jgi:hypothetical protein
VPEGWQTLNILCEPTLYGDLLEQRRNLPDSSDFKAAESRRQQLLIESGLRQIGNQQERSRLRDINEYVDELIAPFSEA